jgi:hypothetical protein
MAEVDATRGRGTSRRRTRPNTGSIEAARVATDHAGRSYLLGGRLREGGTVFEASTSEVIGPVVVKLFPAATRIGERALAAFGREVALAAALDHPNIGGVLGAGRLNDGTPFLAMQRLQGETLKELLDRRGPLSAAEAHAVVAGVTAGLSAAHAAGLVHGTLRLEDVFVVEGDLAQIRLLNFGARHLAKQKRSKPGQGQLADAPPPGDEKALASLVKALRRSPRASTSRPAIKKVKASVAPRERITTKAVGQSLDPSSVSQLFFDEGERLSNEAMAAHAALASKSLAIPRRRAPMVAWTVGILLAMLGLAIGGWFSLRKPLAAVRPTAAPVARTNEVASAPAEAPAPPSLPAPVPRLGARSPQRPASQGQSRSTAGAPPLRGYVWSPAAHRLVPTSAAPQPSSPPVSHR